MRQETKYKGRLGAEVKRAEMQVFVGRERSIVFHVSLPTTTVKVALVQFISFLEFREHRYAPFLSQV